MKSEFHVIFDEWEADYKNTPLDKHRFERRRSQLLESRGLQVAIASDGSGTVRLYNAPEYSQIPFSGTLEAFEGLPEAILETPKYVYFCVHLAAAFILRQPDQPRPLLFYTADGGLHIAELQSLHVLSRRNPARRFRRFEY